MKRSFFLLCVLIASFSCKSNKDHSLVVDIHGWGDSQILAFINNENDEKVDTLIAVDGVVTINLDTINDFSYITLTRLDDLFQKRLRLRSKAIEVMLLKGEKATITGEMIDGVLYYDNSLFEDFAELYARTLPYEIAADSLDMLIEVGVMKNDTTINPLFDLRGDRYDKIRTQYIEYVRENPESDFSAYLTAQINTVRFMECYNLLSEKAKSGKYKYFLSQKYKTALEYQEYLATKNSGNIAVGKLAPDFTLPSLDNKELSLSDYRGKWVILDFWGSWCGWCINGVPAMKKFYDKNSHKVEILGIACNDTDEAWRNSVAENEMNWVNLFENNSISTKYAVSGFPTKILIDPDGVIRDITDGESKQYYANISKIIGII